MDQPASGWLLDGTWGWKGLGAVARNGEGGEMETKSGMKDAGGREGRRRGFLGAAGLLLLCITACQAYYYHERLLPAISGVVLDMQTGKPISGAQVGATYLGPMESLAAPARPIPIGGGGTGKTDAQGRFSFPSAKLPVSSPVYFLFGPNEVAGIWLVAYSRDYVTCLSESGGLNWKQDKRLASYSGVSLDREGSKWKGFRYTIRLARPESEEQWQEKTGLTLRAASSLPQELADRWRFDDLIGYLERWPQGGMARKYYDLLWESANLVPCNPYERDDFARGELSRERLRTYCDRAAKIIAIAKGFKVPPPGMTEESFRKDLDEQERQLLCGRELLAWGRADAQGETR